MLRSCTVLHQALAALGGWACVLGCATAGSGVPATSEQTAASEAAPAKPALASSLGAQSPAGDSSAGAAVSNAPGQTEPAREGAEPVACGALECLAFASPTEALAHVLARNPSVLAVGETHALKTAAGPRSATLRFQEELLPVLRGRASSLVVELLAPDAACRPKTEAVRQKQAVVTEQQRESDQGEFVSLGQKAKELGITPFILRPDCAQYQSILDAGDDAISRMLTLIAELTEKRVRELHAETARRFPGKMVLTYGGALHNDVVAKPNAAAWTFGPSLLASLPDQYVELDLIVPEFIKDSDVWRALPWYAAYQAGAPRDRTLLYHPSAQAYALIFPRSSAASSAAPAQH